MRVLTVGNMFPPRHLGGYELTWKGAVDHLRERGHDVRVLTTDFELTGDGAAPDEDAQVFRELGWYWSDHRFPPRALPDVLHLERRNASLLARHLDEHRPHVVSWWAMGGMSLSLLAQVARRGIPSTGVVGDDWMIYGPQVDPWIRLCRHRPLRWLRRPIERLAGVPAGVELAGTHWQFVSQTVRRGALQAGHDLPRTELAHPGVDARLFPRAEVHEWRWRMVYAGRIDERKGVDTAIDALLHLPGDATLEVRGPGDERESERLRARAAQAGLAERVAFSRRPRERLHEFYAAADALVFPVRWAEPWGLVPLEAMSVGLPVVATGQGGSGEYLEHDRNALVFDVTRGPQGLAAAVRRLGESPKLRAKLREAGFATAARFPENAFNARVADSVERAAR